MTVRVIPGDMREELPKLRHDGVRVHSIVTDPPYHLTALPSRTEIPGKFGQRTDEQKIARQTGFMGKQWDGGDIAFQPATWRLCFDLLPPGGHLLAFAGTRTYHRMACAIEDAGFEMRDTIMYLYGSGFPKAHNLKNKPEIFCQCEGNALPNGHAKQTAEHDLRPLREADLSAADNIGDQRGEVLFPSLPQSRAPQHRTSRSQSEPGAGEQPGVDGRSLRRAGQGLCDGPAAEPSEGAEERLRVGTHPNRREDAGPTSDRNGGSASQGPQSGEQRAEQSEDLREPSGTLDGRALPHGGCCPRCGKLTEAFKGFSTALKPAAELICVARKPLVGTVAANVLAHGTGALNIDGCRVEGEPWQAHTATGLGSVKFFTEGDKREIEKAPHANGRWPANVCHDGSDEVVKAFPDTGNGTISVRDPNGTMGYHGGATGLRGVLSGHADSGSAARFFYSSKADSDDRLGSKHPTVKPVDLMRWLIRLVTPPGGTVLDPFAGSGSTGMACMAEGFDCILIEREAEYVADIEARIAHVHGDDTPLFRTAAD